MSLKTRTEFPQSHQFIYREVTGIRESSIKNWTDVAIGENEAVALRPFGVLRVLFLKCEKRAR